jgi:hypothetical protein
MAERKSFLLRLDPVTHQALQRWADAELRSLNSQIEFVLRRALRDAGRLPGPGGAGTPAGQEGGKEDDQSESTS